MFKLVYFVPETHLAVTKEAVFSAGGGMYKNYDHCAWQTSGTGQFRPRTGSSPYIGTVGAVEFVDEYRVEVLCQNGVVRKVIEAVVSAHPYEEPAYEVYRVFQLADLPDSV